MIRSQNHSSFPKNGDRPMDQELRRDQRRHAAGRIDAAQLSEKVDEITAIVVAQQARAFVDIVTDGQIRWNGPCSHPASGMRGTSAGPLTRWFDTNFYDRRVVIEGELARGDSSWVKDYRVAQDVSHSKPVKPVLPGPVSFARLADDRHYGDLDRCADAVAAVLAEEVAALKEAGATVFQFDEPMLCRHPEDLDRLCRTLKPLVEAAGDGATTILSTYFGEIAELGAGVAQIPTTHLGLDLTRGDENLALLAHWPAGRGVALGLFDARHCEIEDASDVCARLEPYRDDLLARDVIVGPNAGLELVPQDQAFDKLLHARYVVEQLTKEWPWP